VPRFTLGLSSGLVNAALLYPLTRALFAANARFPLPADAALLCPRMIQRLSATRQSVRAASASPLLWPVAEAAIAGYSVREVEAGEASPPRPQAERLQYPVSERRRLALRRHRSQGIFLAKIPQPPRARIGDIPSLSEPRLRWDRS
jgi:hypothetical protein